jgi:hypothetical protein
MRDGASGARRYPRQRSPRRPLVGLVRRSPVSCDDRAETTTSGRVADPVTLHGLPAKVRDWALSCSRCAAPTRPTTEVEQRDAAGGRSHGARRQRRGAGSSGSPGSSSADRAARSTGARPPAGSCPPDPPTAPTASPARPAASQQPSPAPTAPKEVPVQARRMCPAWEQPAGRTAPGWLVLLQRRCRALPADPNSARACCFRPAERRYQDRQSTRRSNQSGP